MNRQDILPLFLMISLAAFIWLRNLIWVSTADDTLPILIALPLFLWFGRPWNFKKEPSPISQSWMIYGTILFLLGILFNLSLLLTIGWIVFLWAWIHSRIDEQRLPSLKKLLVLPLLAFPWISLDINHLGWWFRLSGSWVTANLFSLFGAEVTQQGTNLIINNLPISVEAACAGLNTLQSMLIAGSVAAFVFLEKSSRFWWSLPILFAIAWFANTVRIITLSVAALSISPEFALGAFHTWGAWFVILLMFLLCWGVFTLMEPKGDKYG